MSVPVVLFCVSLITASASAFALARRGATWDGPLWLVVVHPAWWMGAGERFLVPGSVIATGVVIAGSIAILRVRST